MPYWETNQGPNWEDGRAVLHTGLNVAGMLPGVGAVPDMINAGVYAAEGDYGNAALSAAAAIPGVGDGATATKYAVKYGDEVAGAAKFVDDAVAAACSFTADTPVLTDDGLVPIGELVEGDSVLAFNEELGSTGTYSVSTVWLHRDPQVVLLTLGSETLETTPEHPFFVEGRGWVPASALAPGVLVRQADGTPGQVHAVVVEQRDQVMYNLEVAEAHTFFVGEEGWLVHNKCPGSDKQFGDKYGEHKKDYPGMTHTEYRQLADEMYDNPALPRYTYPDNAPKYCGETHIVDGKNLLRLDPDGNFRSLYPGADSVYPKGFPPPSP